MLNIWLFFRLWFLLSVREIDFCYVMRWFLFVLNYREDESEKRNLGYICYLKVNLIYMLVFLFFLVLKLCEKFLNFF